MFLGRNRFLGGAANVPAEGAVDIDAGQNVEFLNQTNRPMPMGMQRFLSKKGINSTEDLFNRLQYAPRMPFRRGR